MAYNLKEQMSKPERFEAGHRLCAGCGAGITCRAMMRAVDPEDKAVICNATSCLEVSSFQYPYTAWQDSYIHAAFENTSAVAAGVESAYKALKRRAKSRTTSKFWPSAATAAPTTSAFSPCPAPWSGATTLPTSAMTTRPT